MRRSLRWSKNGRMADEARARARAPAGAALRRGHRRTLGRGSVALLRLGFLAFILLVWWAAARAAPAGLFASPLAVAEAGWRLVLDGRLGPALLQSLTIYLSGTGAAIVVGHRPRRAHGHGPADRPDARHLRPRPRRHPAGRLHPAHHRDARPRLPGEGPRRLPRRGDAGDPQQPTPACAPPTPTSSRWRAPPARRAAASSSTSCCPGALPFLLAGVRIGATIGLINTVVAELYTAVNGLGGLLALYGSRFQMAEYLAVVRRAGDDRRDHDRGTAPRRAPAAALARIGMTRRAETPKTPTGEKPC